MKLVRSLARRDDGFSVTPKSASEKVRHLCEFCANIGCVSYDSTGERQINGTTYLVTDCERFITPMRFNDLSGLNHPRFNTMRLGDRYERLLKKGDLVAATNSVDRIIGTYEVVSVEALPIDVGMKHARYNHTLIEKELSEAEAVTRLTKIMKSLYHSYLIERTEVITVIYLEKSV